MKAELITQIIELVRENEKTSSTGRTLLATNVIKKIAVLMGGNYEDLNKIQKAVFRSDCAFSRMSDWEYYILL